MDDWHTLLNYNILLKTILNHNLEQKLEFLYKRIPELCGATLETHNLVIMLLFLAKMHQPNLEMIQRILAKIKQLATK